MTDTTIDTTDYPLNGELWTEGWVGLTKTPIRVIAATPKKYRIESDVRVKLGGRNRWLEIGCSALVPRRAVTVEQPA